MNTGRQPLAFTGTLTIDGAKFSVRSEPQGMPAVAFTAELTATTADATTATFTGPSTFQLIAAPTDGCTRNVTLDDGSATRNAEALEGTARGKVKTECAGGSSTVENFLLTLAANRR